MKKEQKKRSWWETYWSKDITTLLSSSPWQRAQKALNSGALQVLKIAPQGTVQGIVQDYIGHSYEQQIQAPAFSKLQIQNWTTYLQQHPHYLGQLLNQQVPPALFEVGETLQAPLHAPIIEAWNMACSCTKRTIPCPHLMVVLLAIQQQIEHNPLWLFQLRGLSLETLFKKEIFGENNGTVLPHLMQRTIPKEEQKTTEQVGYSSLPLQQLDLSGIKNDWKDYMRLLDSQPLFYQRAIKKQLQQHWRKAIQYHKKQSLERADYLPWHQQLQQTKDIALIINKNHQLVHFFALQEGRNVPLFSSDKILEQCIGVLETIDLKELPLYPEAFIALYYIYRFALKLIYEQGFLPSVLGCPDGVVLQWLPAYTVNKAIRRLVEEIARYSPRDLLLLDADGTLHQVRSQQQLLSICHLFASHYLQQSKVWIPEWKDSQQKVAYLFFSGQPTPFQDTKEQYIPQHIQNWLQPFYLGQHQYAPAIKVVEVEEEGQAASFYVQVKVENRGDKKAPLIDLSTFLCQKAKKQYHVVVLQQLQSLVQYYPDLSPILNQESTKSPMYNLQEFEWIFFEVLPLLRMLHIAILLPYSLQALTKPRLGWSITSKNSSPKKNSFISLKSLLKVDWKVELGTEMIEAIEFLKMTKQKSGFIRHKQRYLYLSEEELMIILEQLKTPPPATANQLLQVALSQYTKNHPVELSSEVAHLLQTFQEPLAVSPPQTLQAVLRPYQQVGYAWMYKNAQLGLGALIADDMGLGKTLQVITLLLKFKEEGYLPNKKALVVVPTSLLTNWKQEIIKFAPLLNVNLYHGTQRQLSSDADVILTTYGVARMDITRLQQWDWHCLVIDEAQAIKNVQAIQTTTIKSLKADLNIAMSGTPVENRLAEYWSIMDFVYPNYLGTIGEFTASYSQPIEQENNQKCLTAFRKATAPFILRRLKSDKSIIQDLPDKIEQNCLARLQPMQAELYQKLVYDSLAELQKFKKEPKKRQGLLLRLMSALKQICNHPYQYLQSGGSTPVHSGKSQVLMDLLTRIEQQQEKVLIFTQYRKMGRLMQTWIQERFSKAPMYLHGACSRAERDAMVKAFQHDKQERIFILSLKAAGTGLNLTAANHVIHYDLWWNPAVETQATDRAYRIGQQKNVQVYRFITKGTLEEKIDAMIQSKKDLADRVVSLGEQWLGDLSPEELEELLHLSD